MKLKDAVILGAEIFDLLSDCRNKRGILTVFDIPEKLRLKLSHEERLKVVAWMRKRQRLDNKIRPQRLVPKRPLNKK